jgi:hypothetical protein
MNIIYLKKLLIVELNFFKFNIRVFINLKSKSKTPWSESEQMFISF